MRGRLAPARGAAALALPPVLKRTLEHAMSYTMPLDVYGAKLEAAKGWTCCVCGATLPESSYTMTCKRCQQKEEDDAR